MRGFRIWSTMGMVALLGVMATPAAGQGAATTAAVAAETAKMRAARWVVAARVRLRAAPSTDATVIGGLEVNTPLVLDAVRGDWCEVERADGVRGFVACRLLGETPLDIDAITQPHGDAYDPARAFALLPTFDTFATYANELDQRRRERGEDGPPPPDATLEFMEEELAKGMYGPAPAPRTDVATLQRRVAAAARDDATVEARRHAGDVVRDTLQLWSEPFWEDGERALAVAASLDLPPVRASYFAGDAAIAAGGDTPDQLSGRFGIVHRWVMTKARRPVDVDDYVASTHGFAHGIHLLVRPLRRVALSADGTLATRDSHARVTRSLNQDVMCEGWTPGFALGGLDERDSAWNTFTGYWPEATRDAAFPAGVLYAFYVDAPLPAASATVSSRRHTLDPVATGFSRATSYVFDVDRDAVPDLLVWEAAGNGPGHMDGPTGTDDTWYRLVLVNIAGRWKVLGADQFSYGCGC